MTRFLRTLVLTIGLLCHGQGGATGLLPELDASSPAATLGSFLAETRRVEALYETYNAAPTTATRFALADALLRSVAAFDLGEIPRDAPRPATPTYFPADILLRLPEIAIGPKAWRLARLAAG
jgi:hypothetical protein